MLTIKTVNLSEYQLLSLLTNFLEFKLGDLSFGNLPLGTTWKGLPASPDILHATKKKLFILPDSGKI